MNRTSCIKSSQAENWPQKVKIGRISVTVYRRKTPAGNFAFMVSNYSGEKRRFDAYPTATDALEAAAKIARDLSQRDAISATMTKQQTIEYASAVQILEPYGISLTSAVATLAEAVKLVGDLAGVVTAAKFYKARNRAVQLKLVKEVVAELISVKVSRQASRRYVGDLTNRLARFANAFNCAIGSISTADIQAWLDGLRTKSGTKVSTQNYMNFRRAVSLLFSFAVARGYAAAGVARFGA